MVFVMLVGFVPFMVVGIQVLLFVNSPWLKRSLGMLFLLQWFKMVYDQKQHEKRTRNGHTQPPPTTGNSNRTTANVDTLSSRADTPSSKEEMGSTGQLNPNRKEIAVEKNNATLMNTMEGANLKFEINTYKDILILLLVSSCAGFLGGLFGTAGKKSFICSAFFSFFS